MGRLSEYSEEDQDRLRCRIIAGKSYKSNLDSRIRVVDKICNGFVEYTKLPFGKYEGTTGSVPIKTFISIFAGTEI